MLGGWLTVLLAAATAPPAPEPLQPTGKWVVGYAANHCAARRTFGDAAPAEFGIGVAPTQPFVIFTVSTSEPERVRHADRHAIGSVTLESSARKFTAPFASRTREGRRETTFNVDRAALAEVSDAEVIALAADGVVGRFRLAAMPAVLRTLAACEDSMMKAWGVEPETTAPAVAAQPKPGVPARWFGADAFPADALRSGAQGLSAVALQVDASGAVIGCSVVESSGTPSLDRAACAPMLGHGIGFRPALDQSGRPVAATLVYQVSWTSPANATQAETEAPFAIVVTSR